MNSLRKILNLLAVSALISPILLAQNAPPPNLPRMDPPKKGVCPLPILPALPTSADASFFAKTEAPHGKIEQVNYKNYAGVDKRMHIYLPPDYDKNSSARYPVLYLNHGGGDDDSKWSSTDAKNGGNAANILDNLIASGKAKPMIVVMPSTKGIASFTPSAPGKDDACTQEYLKDIIPAVDKAYRTKASRENRALAGLSMGGFVVMHTGLPHLDTFSELYVYSSGHITEDALKQFEENFAETFKDPKFNDQFRVPFYMSQGETDIALKNGQKVMAIINKYGIRNFWVLSDGGHEWANWRRNLHQTAQIMFPDCPAANTASTATASNNNAPVSNATEKWQAAIQTQIGTMEYTWDLKIEGKTFTGKSNSSQFGETAILEGKINGNEITFAELMDTSIRVEYTGKRAGEEIYFTRKVGDFGVETFVAKRIK
jgi:enterochelin esterase-like enzyme